MIVKELMKLLGAGKKYSVYAVLSMVIGLFANLGITLSICRAISLTMEDALPQAYMAVAIYAFLGILMRYVCTRFTGSVKDRIGREVKKDLREKTYDKIVRLGGKSTADMSMAGLTQVSMEGIEQLDLYFSSYIPQFFYAMIAPVILFLISVGMDAKVAVVLLCCVPLIPVSIIAVSKWAKKIFAKYWDQYTSMGDYFLDSVQGLKELKIFKADARQHERMNQTAEEFRQITMKVLTMQLASTTIMDLVAYGGAGLGIAFVVKDLSAGKISVATAIFLMLIAVDFFLPLRAFGSAFHIAMNGVSAGKKIQRLLETPDPVWGSRKVEETDITLEDVTFSYDNERQVLKNINMTFPKVGMSAIVGESGCGKSTIVRLIDGNSVPLNGQIRVGTIPLKELSRKDFYSHTSVVSYNTYLFNDTVRNNFLLAAPDATEKQMKEALEKVNLWKFTQENGGLDKEIKEDASNISGGQKQRLALAVNLVADKDIYIFDEATSNIDVESEAIIMKNIKALSKKKSVIVISHRLENIVPADQIYFLAAGEVKEHGSHKELVAAGKGYAALYNRQKALEEGYREVIA